MGGDGLASIPSVRLHHILLVLGTALLGGALYLGIEASLAIRALETDAARLSGDAVAARRSFAAQRQRLRQAVLPAAGREALADLGRRRRGLERQRTLAQLGGLLAVASLGAGIVLARTSHEIADMEAWLQDAGPVTTDEIVVQPGATEET